jgi:hypothetical protein
MSTNDVALNRLAAVSRQRPTAEDLATQRAINKTMEAVVANRYDPTARPIPEHQMKEMTTKPLPYLGNELLIAPPKRTGWVEPTPLASPVPKGSFIEGVIGGMIDNALGPVQRKELGHEATFSASQGGEGDARSVALPVIPSDAAHPPSTDDEGSGLAGRGGVGSVVPPTSGPKRRTPG